MLINFKEEGEKRERERERKMLMRERNMDRLPLVRAPTGDQTHNLACALTRN